MKPIIVLSLLVFLAACATGEHVRRSIDPGMSEHEVVSVMGKPDSFGQQRGHTVYEYTNRLISGWSWDKTDYSFIFKDDKLIEYGSGEVRKRDVGGIQQLFIYRN